MTEETLLICVVGFVAAVIGAIAGGNSLLTVPVMLLVGIDSHVAIATNMCGVACLSLGASGRFLAGGHVPKHPTVGMAALAVPGSILGAVVAISISETALQAIVVVSMLAIALFLVMTPTFGEKPSHPSRARRGLGYGLSSVWAIYGGLFSGGYTTVLTVAAVPFFGVSLLQSVALTKVVNAASSIAAVIVFASGNAIQVELAVPFALTTTVGGLAGAHLAARGGTQWLRRVIIAIVLIMATAVAARLLWPQ